MRLVFVSLFVFISASLAMAADASAMSFLSTTVTVSVLGVALAATGCGIAMGLCITSALQGIARQPEITGKLQLNMMLGLAFIESLVLYTLFLAIILLFANPFTKYLG
ncbi:MAG: ATP synthase F0 subunit C [Fibrobacter sp.]|nr:ATP synthase F0 subunit C [Fibrobacter sp.]